MPIISQFYGIIVKMFFNDNLQHNLPHIHVEYAGHKSVFDFDSNMLSGDLPIKQKKNGRSMDFNSSGRTKGIVECFKWG